MNAKLYIDFETRSAVDLPDTGVYVYAEDESTEILCLGYAFNDEPVAVVAYEDIQLGAMPQRVFDHIRDQGEVIAHNASFELALWNYVGWKRLGWPFLPPLILNCTMGRAYSMSLPGSLEKAAAAVGLSMQKDMGGHRTMMKMCKPRKRLADGKFTWWEDAADFKKLYHYCAQDVEVERELDRRLLQLSPNEKKIWLLDRRINDRGIYVDKPLSLKAVDLVAQEQRRLNWEISTVTKGEVGTYTASAQLKAFVNSRGIATESVDKESILNLLARTDVPADVRRALEIRQEAAKSSIAKLNKLILGANTDGRMRGMFEYHAAGTGRWGGRRFQPQNIPRQKLEQKVYDDVFEALADGTAIDYIQLATDKSPMAMVSECLRGFLTAAPGCDLYAMDFKAIEARVIAWLAGEESVLEVFRGHGLIYELAASGIFGVPLEQVGKGLQRDIGKVTTLACGFQGGVEALQAMAQAYRVSLAPALGVLWEKADQSTRDWALKRYKQEQNKTKIPKEEWLASELTKMAWRKANPAIVQYWADCEEAAIEAVQNPGGVFHAGASHREVKYKVAGSFLFCLLPSGRALCYPYPKIDLKKTPWGSEKETLTYMSENANTRRWERVSAYGGLLVENSTQGLARDLLAAAMVRVEEAGFPIVLHVHDELVTEAKSAAPHSLLKQLEELVSEVPEWAFNLPIAAEGWFGKRYRK